MPPSEELERELITWLTTVECALGRRPVIYVTGESFDTYIRRRPLVVWAIDRWPKSDGGREPEARSRALELDVEHCVLPVAPHVLASANLASFTAKVGLERFTPEDSP